MVVVVVFLEDEWVSYLPSVHLFFLLKYLYSDVLLPVAQSYAKIAQSAHDFGHPVTVVNWNLKDFDQSTFGKVFPLN